MKSLKNACLTNDPVILVIYWNGQKWLFVRDTVSRTRVDGRDFGAVNFCISNFPQRGVSYSQVGNNN